MGFGLAEPAVRCRVVSTQQVVLCKSLAEPVLGTRVIVVNKPGGGGALGVTQVAQAKPDGYTLAAVWNAPLTVIPHTLGVSYTLDDYTPVTQLTGGTPFVFCVKPEFPATNGAEFVEMVLLRMVTLLFPPDPLQ